MDFPVSARYVKVCAVTVFKDASLTGLFQMAFKSNCCSNFELSCVLVPHLCLAVVPKQANLAASCCLKGHHHFFYFILALMFI